MLLERILQSQGFGSRKVCRFLVEEGRVCVAGSVCDEPDRDFVPEGLLFSVDGEPWFYQARAYVMLNKPEGYECSHQPKHHASVYALLPPALNGRGVQSLGRLDADTTGLLLFSDDGQFIHAVSSGKRKVPKVYRVTLKHALTAAQQNALLTGVMLVDERQPVRAAACELLTERTLLLTLTEGKYHQVKRMLAAVGNRVEALCRVAVGGLALPDDLALGAWRWLNEFDRHVLFSGAADDASQASGLLAC